MPAGNCFWCFRRVHPPFALRATATHSAVAHHGSVGREKQRSFMPTSAVFSKRDVPARQPLDPLRDKPRSEGSLEEEFGMDPGVATTEAEFTEVLNGGGSGHAQVERTLCIHHAHPVLIIVALETRVREDLMTLPEESGSWDRHAEDDLLHHCLIWDGPELGLPVPGARPGACPCARQQKRPAQVAHCRGDAQGQEPAPCRRRQQLAKGSSRHDETSRSSEAARTEQQKCKGQRRQGKLRLGRDLLEVRPARPRDSARQFPRRQSGWPMFFALVSSLSRETEFTKFVSRHRPFPSRPEAASDHDAQQPAPSCALWPPRSTSRDCRPHIVLSRTGHWGLGPSW